MTASRKPPLRPSTRRRPLSPRRRGRSHVRQRPSIRRDRPRRSARARAYAGVVYFDTFPLNENPSSKPRATSPSSATSSLASSTPTPTVRARARLPRSVSGSPPHHPPSPLNSDNVHSTPSRHCAHTRVTTTPTRVPRLDPHASTFVRWRVRSRSDRVRSRPARRLSRSRSITARSVGARRRRRVLFGRSHGGGRVGGARERGLARAGIRRGRRGRGRG